MNEADGRIPSCVSIYMVMSINQGEIRERLESLRSKSFTQMILHDILWHINVGDSTRSLSMFNDFCENVLKLIGSRLVSLRLTLSNVTGGWSLVSSALHYHRTTLLQRLHLIDIEEYEFNKLLHTLLIDVTIKRFRTMIKMLKDLV